MNRHDRRKLESELRSMPAPPPPPDLVARLKAEIPADLGAADDGGARPAAPHPARRWPLRLAASLAIAAVGGLVAWQASERIARQPLDATLDEARRPSTPAPPAPPPAAGEPGAVGVGQAQEQRPLKGSDSEPSRRAPILAAPLVKQGELEEDRRDLGLVAGARAGERDLDRPRPELAENVATQTSPSMEAFQGAAAPTEAPTSPPQVEREALLRPRAAEPKLRAERSAAGAVAPAQEEVASGRWQPPSPEETALEDRVVVQGERDERARRKPEPAPAPPSTGGSAEPNEQPYGDMFFRPAGTNPFVDTAEDPLSTFALDVDTGSYTLAREYLRRGHLPPPEAIRVEEFVNAFDYRDRAPRRGDFALYAQGAPSPFAPGERYRLLRFAAKARAIDAGERKPAVLTFVVDVSGSMDRENRLELVKRALGLLLDELRSDDRVALVVYGSRGRVLERHTRDHEEIRAAIERLAPEGSTNAEEGLRLGYELADEGYRAGAVNRVVLCSDGVANVGATGPESILERIGAEARRGIELTTVGFGMGNYNDALMERLADQGDGRYAYVDTLDEARRIFVEEATGTLETVAADAKVQVEFEPRAVERWRLLGYENRDVADRDFRNDRVDAGELGGGHAATALYEIRLAPGARRADRIATLHLRWKSKASGRVEELEHPLFVRDLAADWDDAPAPFRLAGVVAELAEQLERNYWARDGSLAAVAAAARAVARDLDGDERAEELADLARTAARLAGERPDPRREDDGER